MIRRIRNLIERQMQKAVLEGKLQGLKGEGKPLENRPEDAFVSAGDAVGFRMMAEAGVLPEEILLKKEIAAQREALKAATSEAERAPILAKLTDLELRYNIATEARQKFMKS